MFEELNERRKAVERNIAKGFGMDDADLDFEKALEDELEKGRAKKNWSIGDTFTRHGITYKCTGISANTGRPTWSKVKDGESGKQEQPEQKSGSGYGKKIPDEQVKSFARILKQVDAMHTDASRYIDEDGMDDEQLANFKIVIDTFKNDQNLNASTRRNIANWGDLVDEEIKFRKEQKKFKKKSNEENKALSKELDSVSGFKRMTLHGPGYDYFEISKLSSGVYSLRGYKSQSSSPLLRTYSKKEILDKIKELNLKSSGVKTDPSLTNGL